MNTRTMTMEQIRKNGLEALARELGPVGMVRFIQQFEKGSGNYTKDRHRWLGTDSVHALADKAKTRRKEKLNSGKKK